MKLLEQLRHERAQREKVLAPPGDGDVCTGTARQPVLCAIETLYSDLTDLAEGLNQLDADARTDYEIESVGRLSDLHQRSYAVRADDAAVPRFVFVFDCVGTHSLTRLVSTHAEREIALTRLKSFGLSFSVDGNSAIRYAIVVKPIVPVRLEFTPASDGNEIKLTVYNLNRLGCEIYSIHPEDVTEELIDELGKLIIRRENRFFQLIGNYISVEARERLRSRLQLEGRTQSKAISHSSNYTRDVTAPKVQRMPRQAPMLISNDSQVEGWVNWGADCSTPPASAARTRGEANSGAFRLTRYAWVITKDLANPDPSESIAKRGPPGTSQAFPTPIIISNGNDFRLMSADGEVRYCGMILGKYQGLEPMLEFGRRHACCHIEYLREGNWVRFEPTE